MKTTTIKTGLLIAMLGLVALGSLPAQTPTSIWDYSAVTSASGSDKLFIYSSSASKTITVDNLMKSRTFVTPTLGVASATSINKLTITAPATGSTLTIADGKTLTASNTLTLAGTDGTTMTFPAASGKVLTSSLSTNAVDIANSIWGASNALVLEGATADGFEISLTPADATADVVYLLPDAAAASYAVMSSTLTTNAPDIANSVYGVSNGLMFEGATANTSEAKITSADVTADVVLTIADAAAATYSIMTSTLASNAADIANSVYGVSNGLMFEGATADASEIKIQPADATADVVYLLPNAAAASYAVMSSSLATNAVDIANSVTGASNALTFEGLSADAHETSLAPTDPTADRTITLPNATGTVHLAQASTAASLTADDQEVAPGQATVIQLSSDNVTATDRTFTLGATAAITGQIYVIIGPASNACELADTGIQKLSATWTPGGDDTLMVLFDGTNFIELARADN